MMGLLNTLQSVLRDSGDLDECPDCGEYTMPAENRCPDCIEQKEQ